MPNGRSSFGTLSIDPSIAVDAANDGVGTWTKWLNQQGVTRASYLDYNSFSGVDIKCAVWVPPHKYSASGSYKIWSELQTLTISSERPAGPVRTLGVAGVRDYVRGVRTIAGSMVFTVLDRDVFADIYQNHEAENPAEHPLFVDQIPPFHIIISANNEMGFSATASIIGVTLTNFGQTYSVDDLMLEATYTYVAKYASPFMNKKSWRAGLAQSVSNMQGKVQKASSLKDFINTRNAARNRGRVWVTNWKTGESYWQIRN